MPQRKSNTKPRRSQVTQRRAVKKYQRFERAVSRQITTMLKDLQDAFVENLIPRLEVLKENYESAPEPRPLTRLDAEGDGGRLTEEIDQIEEQFLTFYNTVMILWILRRDFDRINEEVEKDLDKALPGSRSAVVTSGTQEILNNSMQRTLTSIQLLQTQVISDIRQEVALGLSQGSRWGNIIARIKRSMTAPIKKGERATPFRKANSKGKFIARNEVNTTIGLLNKEKQTDLGIRLYRWQSREDNRVRDSHKALNGRIFTWEGEVTVEGTTYRMANDPQTGFYNTIPGEPTNCRCFAVNFIPAIEESEDDE